MQDNRKTDNILPHRVKTDSKQPLSSSNQVNKNHCGLTPTANHPHFYILVILPLAQNKSSMSLFHCVGCCACHFLLSSPSSAPHFTLFISPLLSQYAPTLIIYRQATYMICGTSLSSTSCCS